MIVAPGGGPIAGPSVSWKGRRHGRRQDRRWARAWSPEQIARRLPIDFPNNMTMRISHEAIYQALFIQGRGALRRELTACLRSGRALRVPRARTRGRGKSFVTPEIMISERPAEAIDRAVPGHWEGDLILGLGSSAIGTLVERTTRFTMLLRLPRMPGYGATTRMKNGPALAGHGAEAVREAITRTIITLPEQLRRSLTWDQGAEMAEHARLKIDAGVQIYFCDPHSPWQRATNENTNGLLRQYFPKGTDLSVHSAEEIDAVAAALNARPRKTLNWKTPVEALDALLQIGRQMTRCDNRLNPPNTSAFDTPNALPRPASSPPSAASATVYDNALAETINGLYKAEAIHRRGPWRSFEAVEFATLEWVDWFNNRRLLEPIGNVPPAEAEERYYAMLEQPAMAA